MGSPKKEVYPKSTAFRSWVEAEITRPEIKEIGTDIADMVGEYEGGHCTLEYTTLETFIAVAKDILLSLHYSTED